MDTQTATAPAHELFREAGLPPELLELVVHGVPMGRRGKQFHHAVGWLKQLGWSVEDIKELLNRYSAGIAEKFFVRRDLDKQAERSYGKTDMPRQKNRPTRFRLSTLLGSCIARRA